MRTYLIKVTVATTISLLGLSIIDSQANAAALWVGGYGSFVQDINLVGFIPQSKLVEQIANAQNNNLIVLNKSQLETENLIRKIDALGSPEPWKEQIEKEYTYFDSEATETGSNFQTQPKTKDLTGIANTDAINQNIEARYQGLIETSDEKINLLAANKLVKNQIGNQDQKTLNQESIVIEDNNLFSKSLTAGVIIAVSGGGFILLIPVLNAFSSSENQGILGFFCNSFGKPKVPESAIVLHNSTFKKIFNLARKAEKIDDEKFGSKEFLLYLKLRNKVESGAKEYQQICQSIKYLEVAIAAQGSYLKIEQTELRYRSRKQQAFYKFVTENITDDIDKNVFQQLVKNKLAEIVPLVNTEEGKNALKSYIQEINKISQHDLGLKLLALFKKYQLTDFAILRKVSDLIEQVNAQDVLTDKNLMILILENYEVLEKLAPIIGIAQEDIKPETFTKILQYMGLVRRYEKAFQEFQDLIKVLKQWQKPVNSLKIIREQYPSHQYRIPKEFSAKIPGLRVYQKYQEYLNQHK